MAIQLFSTVGRARHVPPGDASPRRARRSSRPSRTRRSSSSSPMLTPILADSAACDEQQMHKAAPSLPRILVMVVFALSCFGLLLFLWLSFGGPVPLKPKGYRVRSPSPRRRRSPRRPTCASPACRSARCARSRSATARNRTVATIEIERRFAPMRADAQRRAAPEDAARRDLRRDDAGHAARRRSPRAAGCPTARSQDTVAARRDLRLAGPGDARGVPDLAAGPGQGHQGPRPGLQRRARHAARASPHDGADVLEVLDSQEGGGAAAGQEHRRRVRRAHRERGSSCRT